MTITVVDDGGSQTGATTTTTVGNPCTSPSTKINVRWHYSANGTSGSWSGTKTPTCNGGTLTIGPQAMEGDLKLAPGTTIKTGYDFTLPGNKKPFTVVVSNPTVVFTLRCVSGAAASPSTLTVPMATQSYPVNNSDWIPSGDQKSALVYQGTATIPNACGGGQMRLDKGGTFTAMFGLF